MKRICLLFCLLQLLYRVPFAQPVNPDLLHKEWPAKWISAEPANGNHYGVYHFRKTLQLDAVPSHFVIHVSADNRYKLYVNGTLVSLGPARGEIAHWNFETVDIASYLRGGRNTLAALVWNFGDYRQEAQLSLQTAFILQGDGKEESAANTDTTWKCSKDSSYQPLQQDIHYAYYVAGPGEDIDYSYYPQGWEKGDYNDAAWKPAKEIFHGLPKGAFNFTYGWMLVPRSIPQVELTPQHFAAIRESKGISLHQADLQNGGGFSIPPNTNATILLDQGFETNAYPVIQFSKGKGAVINVGYTEALYKQKDGKVVYEKGNRNDVEGKIFLGVRDKIVSSGGDGQIFTTLSWRTFRYVQISVQTGDEALHIEDIHSIFTGYPFQYKASLDAGDTLYNKMLEVGWRTARNCAVETYMDCPYYEQLQYVGDTRIQALVSLYNSGDDRLMRNAITQIDESRMAEGITESRHPAITPQQIPPFSLWWIGMLHDYWMYRNDTAFVKSFLPGVRQVLSFFSRYQQRDGSLHNAPYWEFSDWSEGHGWANGIPPLASDGSSSVLDLQLLWAYQLAAQLEDSLGMKEYATMYSKKAAQLMQTIKGKYWDNTRGLYADTKDKQVFSQHANTLAILTGTAPVNSATDIAKKILSDTALTQATIYFKYYVNRALAAAGLGDLYLDQLGIWKENLAYGMTTWAEMSNINASRSDCHAWGASPNIEFFRTVLGIDSDEPGFHHISITPHLGKLTKISGSMPHPQGVISASYSLQNGHWQTNIHLPDSTSGTLHFKGKDILLHAGENSLSIP